MVSMEIMPDRAAWLKERGKTIGGSDAGTVVGKNNYKSNVDLWNEKMGFTVPEDVSSSPFVAYGTKAEAPIRELFTYDMEPHGYTVEYVPNNIWHNADYPFAHVSLDGWMHDKDGKFGVLEIKTANIMNSSQDAEWFGHIPENYYQQVLHEMAVTGAEYAWVAAQRKHEMTEENGELKIWKNTDYYVIRRSDPGVPEGIEILMNAEKKFFESMETGIMPVQILPQI